MSKFFVHLVSATGRYPDPIGTDFVDLDAAYMDASRAAREMAVDIANAGGDAYEYRLQIETGDGSCLLEVPFAEVLPCRVPLGHALTDADGRFLDVDDTFCSVVGRSRGELRGLDLLSITAEVDRARNRTSLSILFATGEPFTIRKLYQRGDGGGVWVHNDVSLFRDGIRPERVIASCRMLTPLECGWEAHDKAGGIASQPSPEALQAGRAQAALRAKVAQEISRLARRMDL